MKGLPPFLLTFLTWICKWILIAFGATSKVKVIHLDRYKKYQSEGKSVIFAFWHENLLLAPYLYHYAVGGDKLLCLVSRSKDGEIMSRILEQFGDDTVRGSSSRGGVAALKAMASRMSSEGYDGGMIPDGPKGPPFCAKHGVFKLSQLSGVPIMPCGISVKRKKRLSSWDRMKVPYFFNRFALSFGEPIYVPKEESDLAPSEALFRAEMEETTQEAKNFVYGE